MKKTILLSGAFIGLLLPRIVLAQGTIYVSNLGQPEGGSRAVASDSWLAQRFQTGTNLDGYVVNSIQLLMNQASGGATGFSASFYTVNSGYPASSLGSLSRLEPLTAGLYTFGATQVTLSPSTDYYVVVTAATPVATGSFSWSMADGTGFSSSDGWSLPPFSLTSNDGSSWEAHRLLLFHFAVDATAVPEPESWFLIVLGLGSFGFGRRLVAVKRCKVGERMLARANS